MSVHESSPFLCGDEVQENQKNMQIGVAAIVTKVEGQSLPQRHNYSLKLVDIKHCQWKHHKASFCLAFLMSSTAHHAIGC